MSAKPVVLCAPDYSLYGTDYKTYLDHYHLYLQALKQVAPRVRELKKSYADPATLPDIQDGTVDDSDSYAHSAVADCQIVEDPVSGASTPISHTGVSTLVAQADDKSVPESLSETVVTTVSNPWTLVPKAQSPKQAARLAQLVDKQMTAMNGVFHQGSEVCSFADVVAFLDDIVHASVVESMAKHNRIPKTWGALGNLRSQLERVQKDTFTQPGKKVRCKDVEKANIFG